MAPTWHQRMEKFRHPLGAKKGAILVLVPVPSPSIFGVLCKNYGNACLQLIAIFFKSPSDNENLECSRIISGIST
jgi:hypothetical protein